MYKLTDLLVRKFVKDCDNTSSSAVRAAFGVLSSVVGIACNVILFLAKLVVGMLLHSISVTADAFNNLSDAASSVIGLFGARIAARPGDKDHPFGHGRAEYIAGLAVAFIILQVGFSFVKSSISKIISPEALNFSLISVIILAASMLVKLWLSFFNRRLAKRIDSSVIRATAADSLNDVLVTGATLASIVISKIFSVNLDGYIGTAVALLVIWSGINIIRDTITPLLGEAADREMCDAIVNKVKSYDIVMGTHDLIVHSYGPSKFMASIHAEIPRNIDIMTAHEAIDRIEREVYDQTGILLVIHMDPIETDDKTVVEKREWLVSLLCELDKNLSMHDFRMVSGQQQINLIFDIVVPHSYSDAKIKALIEDIKNAVAQSDSRCACVITVDKSFVEE